MTCPLLHVLETQDTSPYDDPAVRDIVGTMPQFFCAKCQPILRLKPSDAMKCIGIDAPCWIAGGPPCAEEAGPPTIDPWDPTRL